jgi:Fe-S-cluster containining protein
MPSETGEACMYRGEAIFSCRQCGDCCQGYGGTYVSRADVAAIAAYIGMDADRFEKTYCTASGDGSVLVQQENGFCIFWKDRVCSIHAVKPRMCREWPFIRSVLVDPDNWEKMASMCPGIRKGVPPDVVKKCVETMLQKNLCQ